MVIIIPKTTHGINTGLTVVHPLSNELLPVYTSEYVLPDYATGAVMGRSWSR